MITNQLTLRLIKNGGADYTDTSALVTSFNMILDTTVKILVSRLRKIFVSLVTIATKLAHRYQTHFMENVPEDTIVPGEVTYHYLAQGGRIPTRLVTAMCLTVSRVVLGNTVSLMLE